MGNSLPSSLAAVSGGVLGILLAVLSLSLSFVSNGANKCPTRRDLEEVKWVNPQSGLLKTRASTQWARTSDSASVTANLIIHGPCICGCLLADIGDPQLCHTHASFQATCRRVQSREKCTPRVCPAQAPLGDPKARAAGCALLERLSVKLRSGPS